MPDARVNAAIANWAPRFISNGVDPNVFQRTTARIETWDLWLDAWLEAAGEHRAIAEEAEASGNDLTAGEAYLSAAVCYHFAKFVWVIDVERNHEATALAKDCLYRALRYLDPAAERIEIPFDPAMLVGNLRRPEASGRPPLVLLLAGLDSTKEEFFLWENVFLARGMATFSLDGPGQGRAASRPRFGRTTRWR